MKPSRVGIGFTAGVGTYMLLVVALSCGGERQPTAPTNVTGTSVGAEGGSVPVPAGGFLSIPAGALPSATRITAEGIPDPNAPPGFVLPGSAVRFGPVGTTFATPATLALPLPSVLSGSAARIAYYDPILQRVQVLDSIPGQPGTISSLVPHFTDFIVVFPGARRLKPDQQYTWFLENCPAKLGPDATCNDVREDVRAAFQHWAATVNVRFSEAVAASSADIRIEWRSGGALQWFDVAGSAGWSIRLFDVVYDLQFNDGLTWVPSSTTDVPGKSTVQQVYRAVLHEIGHLLGLEHPVPILPETGYGVMSYQALGIPLAPNCAELSALERQKWTLQRGSPKCLASIVVVAPTQLTVFPNTTIPAGTIEPESCVIPV